MTAALIITCVLVSPLAAAPPAKTESTSAAEAAAKKAAADKLVDEQYPRRSGEETDRLFHCRAKRAAAQIMEKYGVAIDDLFTAVTPHLAEMQNANDVHFNGAGYEFLGQQVGKAIETLLK